MDNLSKEDIDYIFQKGASKQEFTFKESAWDNMEALLDKQDRKRSFYNWGAIGTFFIIIGLGSVYMFSSKSADNGEHTHSKQSVIIAAQDGNEKNNTNEVLGEENQNLLSDKKNITDSNAVKENSKKQRTSTEDKEVNLTTMSEVVYSDKAKSSPFVYEADINSNSKEQQRSTNLIHEDDIKHVTANDLVNTENQVSKSKILEQVNSVEQKSNELEMMAGLPIQNLNMISKDSKFNIRDLELSSPKSHRVSYQLILGKEWSSVGMTSNNIKNGFRLGAGIAYQFGKRFQFSTGFVYSKKFYETDGANYTPQPQFRWTDDVVPETVSGKCDVFEIPLDFTYYFKGYDKNSFFISAGANTYLMNSEWYDLQFSDPDRMADPNIRKSISTEDIDGKCIHYFGIGMVSAGYQKYMTGNTAVQIGPYVQLPFTGIGMGSVDLYSAGVQLKVSFSK